MKKVKFGKARTFLKGKGFMMALILSLTAVGASTYVAYDRAISKISLPGLEENEKVDIGFNNENLPVGGIQTNIPKDTQTTERIEIEAIAEVPKETKEAEEANNFVEPKSPRILPAEGDIITPFSHGELIKSKTLGVWKTHDGVDIAAPLETPVLSMTNGTISEVFSDPLWGICVIIDHSDGVFGHYYGLDKNVSVYVGQKVNSGDVIGMVGNTAEVEIAEEPHLHFAIKKNDIWIDPIEFIENIR